MDCLFCQIAQGLIPAKILHQNETCLAFEDIHPQAPHHIIIIPRRHIRTINDLSETDAPCIAEMFQCAKELASMLNIAETGYRLVMNCNADGGQTIFHIHLHLLGGRSMQWPPG